MAALINALDNYTPKQIGENGHVEYGWSNDIREKILQFSFQLVRTSDSSNLKTILNDMYGLQEPILRKFKTPFQTHIANKIMFNPKFKLCKNRFFRCRHFFCYQRIPDGHDLWTYFRF